jgi:DNA-binding MarR family transcriptional regulator
LQLDNQLCFPLYAAARLVTQAYAPLLEQLGLTYPQYLVLMILWEHDGSTVSEIGERLYLDSGTLTPLLKRMVAARLVRRVRRRSDERTVENWLTPSARALKERAARVPVELLCGLRMPERDLVSLRAALRQLLERLRKMPPPTARI